MCIYPQAKGSRCRELPGQTQSSLHEQFQSTRMVPVVLLVPIKLELGLSSLESVGHVLEKMSLAHWPCPAAKQLGRWARAAITAGLVQHLSSVLFAWGQSKEHH